MTFLNRILAVGILLGGGVLQADTIDLVSASWSSWVGGSGVVTGPNGQFTDIRWGTDIGNGKSGLGFDGVAPPAQTLPALGDPFLLGTLRHYNRPIEAGTAVSSAQLDLSVDLTIGLNSQGTGPYNFSFTVDETSNATPCAHPSTPGNPCSDEITFQNLLTSDTFSIGGIDYTISIAGFSLSVGGPLVASFISQEGANSDAFLYANITAAQNVPPGNVPEPASILGLGTVLFLVGGWLRRRTA